MQHHMEIQDLWFPALTFLAGVIVGFLLKGGVLSKWRKRVNEIEDEKLDQDAQLLKMGKKISDLNHENNALRQKDDG